MKRQHIFTVIITFIVAITAISCNDSKEVLTPSGDYSPIRGGFPQGDSKLDSIINDIKKDYGVYLIYKGIREDIVRYVFDDVVSRYAGFDPAHRENHAITVIGQAMELLDRRESWLEGQPAETVAIWSDEIDREVLFTAAACHDLGLVNGRDNHHTDSGIIIHNDSRLKEWFTEEQIELIAQAAEDHRASGKSAPRSIYGKIVAEADRVIDAETIILRTVQFGFTHYPGLDREGHIERAVAHLKEKYGRGGYLKLWIPWSDNAIRLNALQNTIADDSAIHRETVRIYETLI